jgi:hypothetical protein
MSHYIDSLRLESDQKDLLISELKAENFELRNKERHYHHMHDTIGAIEHDCAIISEEKRAMEEDMRRRSEADGKFTFISLIQLTPYILNKPLNI